MPFYRCNPFTNTYCGKRKCYINGGDCFLTTDNRYSIDGKPLTEENHAGKPNRAQERIKERWLRKEQEKEEE